MLSAGMPGYVGVRLGSLWCGLGTYGVRGRRGGGEDAACEEHERSLHCAGCPGR